MTHKARFGGSCVEVLDEERVRLTLVGAKHLGDDLRCTETLAESIHQTDQVEIEFNDEVS